uniref:DNA ligase 4 n=1 Tax=Blastobotrys adeninivorans TaxID=409370 RepID=A0A060SZN6_BLAAD
METVEPPKNHGPLPPFHTLVTSLLIPLSNLSSHSGGKSTSVKEVRRRIVDKFINNWREKVGNDIYPALRLVMPDKDRERAMYSMKEKVLGKYLVRVLKISPESPDAQALMNWKQGNAYSAGNFSERCYDIIKKRETKSDYGTLTIGQVNELLDKLSGESDSQAVIQEFYDNMNSEEMRWLIRAILRNMRIHATEKTILEAWHPDAMALFNVTSNLKRTCWELWDPDHRLSLEQQDVSLMACFQPQLAMFTKGTATVVKAMPSQFLIEEKIDGERMQIHIAEYGKSVKYFSRRATEYTHLYGASYSTGPFSTVLQQAINSQVENCILDGEMATWDRTENVLGPFGTLKTAAKGGGAGLVPIFLAFDVLLLNDVSLTMYPLKERKKALNKVISNPVPGSIEILAYEWASSQEEVNKRLQRAVEESSEGLIVKNPERPYDVNSRNDSWYKVKPEYLTEFEETFDVCVIGGFYGSGKRRNQVASFLCGLRVDKGEDKVNKFHSFCKVGGGLSSADFAELRHKLGDKFQKWSTLAKDYIEIAAGSSSSVPDVWIRPDESLVFEVKASQIVPSTSFRTGQTLRFPRFKQIRHDKDWKTAASLKDFHKIRREIDALELKKIEENASKRARQPAKKKIRILGATSDDESQEQKHISLRDQLFAGIVFYVISDVDSVDGIDRDRLRALIKAHGGSLTNSTKITEGRLVLVADKKILRVSNIMKMNEQDIIKPIWVTDCIKYGRILELEPRYVFHATPETNESMHKSVDMYGDPYTRKIGLDELKVLLNEMNNIHVPSDERSLRLLKLELVDAIPEPIPGLLFPIDVFYFDEPNSTAQTLAEFAGGTTTDAINEKTTAVVVNSVQRAREIRKTVAGSKTIPRIVTASWITESWKERTRLPEDSKFVNF